MIDPFDQFEDFCSTLTITSKDAGVIPLRFNGAQREALRQIRAAFQANKHYIVILKPRQVGISTLCLALDLYWASKFPDTQGAMVSDTDDNRDVFRSMLGQYHSTLPPRFRIPIVRHNRTYLKMRNRSILQYMVAGTKKNATLGQGRALNFVHRTEVSSYGDPGAMERMEESYSQTHPFRLYIDESTAKQFNHFYDLWEAAKQSVGRAAIFLAWWMMESYRIERTDTLMWGAYGGPVASREEERIAGLLKERYGVTLSEEQLAWRRWKLNEQYRGDLALLNQEHPSVEEDAFQYSGTSFFSAMRLAHVRKEIEREPPARYYRYALGNQFTEMRVHEVEGWVDGTVWHAPVQAQLAVYREPVPQAIYAIGCDPAYGFSEWNDRHAVQVLRCWGSRVEQVAEFAASDLNTQQFAWVIVHLAAFYLAPTVIVELDGPGMAVHQELRHIQQTAQQFATRADGQVMYAGSRPIFDCLRVIKPYLWQRQDSLTGNLAYQWKSGPQAKETMLTHLQVAHEQGNLVLHSLPLLSEMASVTREGESIEAQGRAKDDRVIALGLAVLAWNDWLRAQLLRRRVEWQPDVDVWSTQSSQQAQVMEQIAKGRLPVNDFLPRALQQQRPR